MSGNGTAKAIDSKKITKTYILTSEGNILAIKNKIDLSSSIYVSGIKISIPAPKFLIYNTGRERGLSSKLQQQINQLRRAKQKLVMEMIEAVLQQAS